MGFQTQLGLFKFELERRDFKYFLNLLQIFRFEKILVRWKTSRIWKSVKKTVRKQPEFQNLQKSKIRNPNPGVHCCGYIVPSVTS